MLPVAVLPVAAIRRQPVAGTVVALADVPDAMFAQGTMGPGLAIEFDINQDAPRGDPAGAHISIHTRGADSNSADEAYAQGLGLGGPPPLSDLYSQTQWVYGAVEVEVIPGSEWAWVRVYLDLLQDELGRPEMPVVSAQIPVATLTAALGSHAYLGFTGSTSLGREGAIDIARLTVAEVNLSPFSSSAIAPPTPVEIPAGGSVVVQARDPLGNDLAYGGDACSFNAFLHNGTTQVPASVEDNADGTYTVSYAPTSSGPWSLFVHVDDLNIAGSPFSLP